MTNPTTGSNAGQAGTREQIFEALFKLVSASSLFETKSRKLKLWNEVPKEQRPAIFQHEMDEDYKDPTNGPPGIVLLHVELFIYTNSSDVDVPATLLNNCLDAVCRTFRPNMLTGMVTLGGLVDSVYINGKVFKDPGDLDGDGLAIVPVTIRVPSITL